MSAAIGRPKGGIWDYFRYDEKEGQSECIVTSNSENEFLCNKTLKGKFTTNLKSHLKQCHAEEYKKLEEEEKKQKEKLKQKKSRKRQSSTSNLSLQQKSLIDIEQERRKYEEESAKKKSLTQKLAIFIGSSIIAIKKFG